MSVVDDRALQKILNMIDYIKTNTYNKLLSRYRWYIYHNIFNNYKQFANALFKAVNLQFVPLYVVTEIGIRYFSIKKKVYDHYIKFIKNNQQVFIILHEELRKKRFQEQSNDENYYIEQVKQILLDQSHYERDKPLNSNSLLKTIYDRIYNMPYIPKVSDMYDFYLQNIPPKLYNSRVKPMPKYALSGEQNEEIKRLPWKSKLKVNAHMKQNQWTELQKEAAREYLMYDSFNEKQNRKYQLKAVAPRHTLIIDLFYAKPFTYLLAINVNTRKAFAIPSPLIKEFTTDHNDKNRKQYPQYLISKDGHKTTDNIINMVKELLKQTPIKMIICDQESAFGSDEFVNFCVNNGIRVNNYVINRVSGVDERSESRRVVHNSLAILDRFCRTLRNMAYNIGIINQEIDPHVMQLLIHIYNNSPHTTFYRIFKKPITPNEMDSDKLLEDKLCYYLVRHNFVVRNSDGYDIRINSPVRIKNESDTFDKLKHKLLPGIFEVIGRDNNLFICKQGKNIVKVPRYMIKTL